MAKLKVYRTPIGFHDAYVAAPSQKAALVAWGASRNLFARGMAELVTDPDLTREPLAAPGTVVKRSRGTADEQMAALPLTKQARRVSKSKRISSQPTAAASRPDRSRLDAAEHAIEDLRARQHKESGVLAARIAALKKESAALDRSHNEALDKLENARRKTAEAYERALARWRA